MKLVALIAYYLLCEFIFKNPNLTFKKIYVEIIQGYYKAVAVWDNVNTQNFLIGKNGKQAKN